MEYFQVHPFAYTDAYAKVLAFFFSYPTQEVTLNQLVAKTKISKSSAQKVVKRLITEEFLQQKTIGRSWLISCNQQHRYNFSRKIAYFFGLLLDAGLVNSIRKAYPTAKAIILFGSYRKGDAVEKSDIDVAVELGVETKFQIIDFGIFKRLGYLKDVPLKLHLFSRKRIASTLFANLANGVVLDGFLEVQP